MREIRTLLQSVLPNVAVASAGPVASSSAASAVASTSRQREPPAALATVASTSRQGASPRGSAPMATVVAPPWRTGEGLMDAVGNPIAGIVDDIHVLQGDTQAKVA